MKTAKTTTEFARWSIVTRINKAGNLTLEIALDGDMHAEVILQEGGVIDLSGRVTPWDIGPKGWENPGRRATSESSASSRLRLQ